MRAVDQTTLLEYQLRLFLLADADIAALVADRIFPAPAPQNAVMPLVTLQRISAFREYTVEGRAGLSGVLIQVDCWADAPEYAGSYALAKVLAETVRLPLESFRGFMGRVKIQEVTIEAESDVFESMDRTRRVSVDYRIWHDEWPAAAEEPPDMPSIPIAAAAIVAGALVLDASAGAYRVTLNADITSLSIINAEAGSLSAMQLELVGDGTPRSINFGAWQLVTGQPVPTSAAGRKDVYTIQTDGTNTYVWLTAQNVA